MNLIKDARYALKLEIPFRLATPLLLRSGLTGDVTDSSIERTFDGRLFINGYVWASLLRRSLQRLPEGAALAAQIGKYQDDSGVSPLWCEQTFAELHKTAVNPGIAIDRKWGAAKAGALFNDELAIAGLPLTFRATLFADSEATAQKWRQEILKALRIIHEGVENIGGGWTYGYGRLHVESAKTALIDLKQPQQRKLLWLWDGLDWQSEAIPASSLGAAVITVKARVEKGQLLAVKSGVFPLDAPKFGKLPDWFVFRRNRLINGMSVQEPVIPGKAIRQALFSVPLERKLRSQGEDLCQPSEKGDCGCRRCQWFGSTDAAGIVAVTDAPVRNPGYEVVSRVQLCEHSMQNMNLFSGEYLNGGDFDFCIIIDETRGKDSAGLLREISAQLDELKGKTAPPGWYRLGGTATCTGQVRVIDYTISRSA